MERTFETPGHLALQVRVPSGSIQVRAEARTTTRLRTNGERDPEDFRVAFDERGDGHRLVVEYRGRRGRFFGFGEEIEVTVDVPEGTDVTCESGSADVEVTGPVLLSGAVRLQSVSGDVDAGIASGVEVYLDLGSTSGDVSSDLEGADAPANGPELELTATTVSGDIHVRRAPSRSKTSE